MLKWLSVYRDPKLLAFAVLGLSSGLPFALIGPTLSIWLKEFGISKTTIGAFALVGVFYSVKILWSPLIDTIRIPYLSNKLGQRRSWLILSQLCLFVSILFLGCTNPEKDLMTTAYAALLTAFFSATQDVVIDGYRIQVLKPNQYAAGGIMEVFGYRIGLFISGAGALHLSSAGFGFSWKQVYFIMACVVFVGILAAFSLPRSHHKITYPGLIKTYLNPLKDFVTIPNWILIIVFIILYKLSDAIIVQMAPLFYLELGFSKIDYANVSKIAGVFATILGGFIGGGILEKMPLKKALFLFALLHIVMNCLYLAQIYVGPDLSFFYFCIATENITLGMMLSALIAYMSSLCNVQFASTQYALLSSISMLPRTFFASCSGWLVDNVGWTVFFIVTLIIALPGLFIIKYLPNSRTAH